MRLKSNILLLLFVFSCTAFYSQNTVEFNQLTGDNVPTQSVTYAVANDSIGNVWIASEEGVLKHNSQFYKIYNSYNGLPSNISNRIKEVFIDSKQQVWIGSEKGICVYNEDLDVFDFVGGEGGINPLLVDIIIEDTNNHIWAGGYNGLWRYDDDAKKFNQVVANHIVQAVSFFQKHIVFGTPKGLFIYNPENEALNEITINPEEKNIRYITDFDNQLFIGTKTGVLYTCDAEFQNVKQVDFDFESSNAITDIIKNPDNTYLLATDGDGILKLSFDFKKINHYTEDPNEPYSISSNGVYDIELDKEGILWVATYGGGLNYLNSNQLPFQNIRHKINDKNSVITNFTRAIAKDKNGHIWFGTKKGISIWNRNDNSWKHITDLSNSKKESEVIVLALEPDDNFMWAGTYNEGLYKIDINTLKKRHYNLEISNGLVEKIYAIHKDSNNNIWVGGIEKDLAVISPENEIKTYPIQQIKFISEGKTGEMILSGRNGVYKINHELQTFGLIGDLIPDNNSLAYSTVNCVIESKEGHLILATNGEGLLFYNPNNKKIKKLKINSGIPSDVIQGIIPVQDNNLWVSTTKGLVNVKIKENDTLINVYDTKDGLASTEFNYGSFSKLSDELIVFGGVDGVTLFNPDDINEKSFKPQLVFDLFKLSNKIIQPGEQPLEKHINRTRDIVLNHRDNSIEIQFTGISHSSASKVKYSWILEGFDKEWSVPSTTNFATYTNLNPGTYFFKVKANNKFGDFSETRQLRIEIETPWWATNQAYLLYLIAFAILLYGIIHFTSVIIKKKNADEQIDFFNNITHEIKTPLTILISSLDNVTENLNSEDDSKKRIKTTVKRINALFEQMLNFQKVTSADHLDQDITKLDVYAHIKRRIENFKPLTEERNIEIIFNNNWNENFYYDNDRFDKIMLNLISNAIKYSLDAGKIYINTYKTESGDLKIEIIDEGIGIPKDQQKFILKRYFRARNVTNSQRPGTGLGLMMVKKLIEKNDGSISFESEENLGTTFTLLMKNLKNEFNRSSGTKEHAIEASTDVIEDLEEIADFSNNKILIVEDNDELRSLLSSTLGHYFQVFESRNGKEGLNIASMVFPDIIITDLIMPEMDGMQMAKKLKEDISLNHIPVFMLTVLQNSEQKLESIEIGISEYLEKPIDLKYLIAKIINTLKWQQKLRDKYVHDVDADNAEVFRNEQDQEFLTNLENTIIESIENYSFSVHNLSKNLGMSRTSLYMKLKNLVDLSPQDFVIHTKLKHAKKLLIKGEYSIKEVAYQSGFSNPKYFSTSFKKFYGVTPSGFLDSLKKE